MKTALSDTGEPIIAGDGMPEKAVCPFCGNRVTLRRRRQMNGDVTYFWRHVEHSSRSCRSRSKPYKNNS